MPRGPGADAALAQDESGQAIMRRAIRTLILICLLLKAVRNRQSNGVRCRKSYSGDKNPRKCFFAIADLR